MTNFERLKMYYEKGWADEAALQQYVSYGVITQDEYEQIVGASE